MKRILITSVCALALTACERAAEEPVAEAPEAAQALTLGCDAFRDASAATLAAAYGAENLVDQVVPGPEGETYTATVLYPNDPARRLEITWRNETERAGVFSLSVRTEENTWIGPNGLAMGQTLADVETANGRPFNIYGFEWDYGGRVANWNGGAFAASNGCNISAAFSPRATTSGAIGDSQFGSDSAGVRAADPVVAEFALTFAPPE